MVDWDNIDMAELEGFSTKMFPKGDIIFEKGDQPDCAYLIRSRKVNIVAQKGTTDIVLNMLSHGDFFGEMAPVNDEPRSARAVVDEDAELRRFLRKRKSNRVWQSPIF